MLDIINNLVGNAMTWVTSLSTGNIGTIISTYLGVGLLVMAIWLIVAIFFAVKKFKSWSWKK